MPGGLDLLADTRFFKSLADGSEPRGEAGGVRGLMAAAVPRGRGRQRISDAAQVQKSIGNEETLASFGQAGRRSCTDGLATQPGGVPGAGSELA